MSRWMIYAIGGLAVTGLAIVGGWAASSWSVEKPPYTVLRGAGQIELRDYPALRVAEVMREGSRQDAVRAGFRPLARYIFARERAGDSIAMTAPVTQIPDSGDRWTVQFIMPAHMTLDDLPLPAGEDVRLAEWPARRKAAIRFGGVATDARIAEAEARLRGWMAAEGIEAAGPPIYAYYNDPFTPGFLRRNEVLIPVATDPAA